MADIQTQLPVRLTDNVNTAQIVSNSGGAIQVLDVSTTGMIVDDAAFTVGTDRVHTMGAFADETTPDSVNEGDVGAVRMTLTRILKTKLIGDDGGTDTTVQTNSSGQLEVVIASGGSTEYAEDTAHTTADLGSMILAVRNDANTSLVDTDGDYAPLQVDATGNLKVAATVNIAYDYAEDTAHTTGDTGAFVLAVRNDTFSTTLTSTTGDYSPIAVDSVGKVFTGDNKVEDVAHASGDVGSFVLAVRNDANTSLVGTDGDYAPLQVDANGRLKVDSEFTSPFDFAEDAAHASGDRGAYVLAVRNDAGTTSVSADGDYASLQTDSAGALWVRDNSTLVDDAAFTVATSRVMPIGALADETATDSVNEGDIGAVRMTLDRQLRVKAERSEISGGVVHNYATVSAVASASTGDIDYDRTGLTTTFYLKQVIASSSGAPCKVTVTHTAGATTVFVGFYATSSPFLNVTFDQPIPVTSTATDAVTISIENNAGSAQDVYGTIIGIEV